MTPRKSRRLDAGRYAAVGFVLLWATGFLGAKLGLPHADPVTLLGLRFAIVSVVLAAAVLVFGLPRPSRGVIAPAALIGILNHGVYLGGVFVAISSGLSAGLAALIAGLSPIFTAAIAAARGRERMTAIRWSGMALGVTGVALAVGVAPEDAATATLGPVLLCVFAASALGLGAALQSEALAEAPLAATNAVQYAAATALFASLAVGAPALGLDLRLDPTPAFFVALGWLVLVLSIGAISLLYWLLRHGAAASVSSLFFLTPGAAAAIAWPLFGETLTILQCLGFAVAMGGVALVNRRAA